MADASVYYGETDYTDYSYQSHALKSSGRAETFLAWAQQRRGLWPSLPTLCLFGLFGPSMLCGALLAQDPTCRYWIGRAPWIIIAVPVLLVVSHLLHSCARRPRFFPLMCSTVIPAVLVIVSASMTLAPIAGVSRELLSGKDCGSQGASRDFEEAYRTAAQAFQGCATRVASVTNASMQATLPLIDLQDCSEYSSSAGARKHGARWLYLSKLETTQACSGWCSPGSPSLWTRSHKVMDLCSTVAGTQLVGKIRGLAQQMLTCGVFQLFISLLIIWFANDQSRKMGADW
eukprot:TRINITY_DN40996_c0_g1_i1.p1 TRINITY_DN40996_c0_g1~~TRINITY_DN40996_c0_g1_i1.p1  ORF type:complete len:288 (+),score=45.89 TRINITY_DN40996_c0_g1_i1:88-951(+)